MSYKKYPMGGFLNEPEIVSTPPVEKVEARRRGKQQRGRRRGGSGLR